jgi:hypothetical protein
VVPDYYEHIKFPMDLKTMGERLKSDYYKNKRLFIADFKRMLQNCKVSLLSAFRLYLSLIFYYFPVTIESGLFLAFPVNFYQ